MKKNLFVILLLAVVTLAGVTNVYAMSEADLKAKASQDYYVNGVKADVPANYIKLLNDYLDAFNVSEADCQYIADQIDYLYSVAQTKNITNAKEMRQKAYAEVKTVASNVSANTKVKVTVEGNGVVDLKYYDDPSKTFRKIQFTENGEIIAKNTGSVSLLYVAGVVSLLGAGLLVYRIRKA